MTNIPPSTSSEIRPFYDAIVLGSGMGGAVCAYRLAERGARVLLVEQGDFLKAPDRDQTGAAVASDYILDVIGSRSEPISCVGGQTKFYGSALYRFRTSDFEGRRLEVGQTPKWPVSYADLAPHYQVAEALFKVHGDDAGDPTAPRRDQPYPYPPVPLDPLVATFADRLERAGARVSQVPRGVDFGPGGACVNCAGCDAFLCRLDAKMDADIAAVRPALSTGRMDLATQTSCVRIEIEQATARATGVHLIYRGEARLVRTDAVICAAGQKGTVELFLRSRNATSPNGVGNHSGQLGRNLAGHSTGMIFPLVSGKPLPPVQTKSFAIHDWHDGGPGWAYPLGVVQVAGQMPFWREAGRWVRPVARLMADHCFTLFYMCEAAPEFEAGFQFDGDKVVGQTDPKPSLGSFARLRKLSVDLLARAGYPAIARRRPPYLWHTVGTTRMGDDPAQSVVDPFGRVHHMKGLYVADAGVLPSAGCVNTGLTIAALALRTADQIIDAKT